MKPLKTKQLQLNLHNTELEKLIQEHYGLIVSQALFFKPKNKEILEDCIQVAVTTFIRVFKKYDKNKAKFSTYISSCIRNAICDYLKHNNKHAHQILHDTPIIYSEQFWELIPDNLTSIEKSIIMLKLENYSKAEIAIILSLTQKEITRIFNQAKNKIKEANQ